MSTVVMPQMGESLAEGTLVRWLKRAGDTVQRDEPLFEISTDKVDTDVPAPEAGVLARILVGEGETVAVGTPVAVIEAAGSERAREPEAAPTGAAEPVPADKAGGHFRADHAPQVVSFRREPAASAGSDAGGSERRNFTPAVLEAARQAGLPLERLTRLEGSGRGGRITKRDVERYLAGGGEPAAEGPGPVGTGIPPEYLYKPGPDDRVVPMSNIRRKIAQHLTWSTRISPHATAFAECDMSQAAATLDARRQQADGPAGAPMTYTVLAASAVVEALGDFPELNASVVGEALVLKPHVNLGVAVALQESGELIVPVIHAADELSLEGLARAVHDVATRARARRLTPADVQGGTFTLTNPGIFGGLTGTPILNQPQVGILGLGAIVKRAVVVRDAIAIRPMMTMALTFDHRAIDGMMAFRFLERVRIALEGLPADESGGEPGGRER